MEDLTVSKGHWSHSVRVSELVTAKAWSMTPSEFDELNMSDQVEMLGLEECLAKITQFEKDQTENKRGKKDVPTFRVE